MTEIGASVASEIVKRVLDTAIRRARYSFCFNKYVEDLRREKGLLTRTREIVKQRIRKSRQETKNVDDDINWLKEADSLIEEVQKLEEKANSNKSCFGHFPSCIRRYRLSKLAEKKTQAVTDLNQKGNSPRLSRLATLPGMRYFSSIEGFFHSENTRMAHDELLEALQDDEVFMVGLYGMGGCGKTTLAKQVGNEAENIFDKVAFAIVSNNVDVHKIQGEIASYLDLPLKERESTLERARRLWARLASGQKILIILDDVWGKLDFEIIGIPFRENRTGCKVLLTTRRLQLCNVMSCQRTIPLSLLNEEEAWTLFQKHSGIVDETSDSLKDLAKEIVKECTGLPIAIEAVASTLKGKSESGWKESLERLKETALIDVEEGLRDPYTCLQRSYDNLKDEEAKSIFLLCSIFPKDCEIHEEYLARYGIGLGLFGEVSSYARARNKVLEAKNKLIDFCLLLKGNKKNYVKMHNVVRAMALSVAKKEKKVIMEIESSGRNITWKENITIKYLWYFNIQESDRLSYLLSCPKLEFLCVILKNPILDDGVFKTMKDLRVLLFQHKEGLSRGILSGAKSIQSLTNLRSLFLEGWNLGYISFIGSLERLESLVLWSCSFVELPDKITELPKLKLLDLWYCVIKRNPGEVIRRCSQLEELYFLRNSGWKEEGEIAVVATSALHRYRIDLGGCYQSGEEDFSISRGLWMKNLDAFTTNATIKDLAQRAEFLEIREIVNSGGKNIIPVYTEKKSITPNYTKKKSIIPDYTIKKNIIPDMVDAKGGGMNELTELHLWNFDKIECFADTSDPLMTENVFSNLVKLHISQLKGLKTLCHGPHVGSLKLFCSLKVLSLSYCPMMTSVFTRVVAQSLVVLEELEIKDCDGLKHIVRDEEKDNNEKHYNLMFPKLRRLSISDCYKLEYLFPVSFNESLVQLESLTIQYAPKLIYVFDQSSINHEEHNQKRLPTINLPSLKTIVLYNLSNIKAICPEKYGLSLPYLKELQWGSCPVLMVESISKCVDGGSRVITPMAIQNKKENAKENHKRFPEPEKSMEPSNNRVSEALDSEKLENAGRTSPISQSLFSMAIAAEERDNIKKMEEKNITEQSTMSKSYPESAEAHETLAGTTLPDSPRDTPRGLDLDDATGKITDSSKQLKDSYQEPSKDSKIKHQLDNLNSRVGISDEEPSELPSSVPAVQNVAEEYGAFRDIEAIKKKHIPLLDQAIAKHPSLWAWHEKFKHPQMKQFGYTMLGNMLEFLASTRWRDLTEDKKAELQSLVDVLETLGFDLQFLGNVRAMINQSNEETVNHIEALEEQVAALEIGLENIKIELRKFSGFIGF
ncbi:hypothetical protein L6164_031649 [Bauhinia variegata]|uniref:Uncharacterized protein n=1 Tax=Bauhinia variegata TaxID=167791 RepID=A0ACB9LHR5_BAUVA|nr:hypothetical protein L6164_031649 [Bauhinia variegata]